MEKPSDNVTLASSLDPITFDCDGLRESREVTSRDFRRDPVRCASLERREPDLAEALSWELLRDDTAEGPSDPSAAPKGFRRVLGRWLLLLGGATLARGAELVIHLPF